MAGPYILSATPSNKQTGLDRYLSSVSERITVHLKSNEDDIDCTTGRVWLNGILVWDNGVWSADWGGDYSDVYADGTGLLTISVIPLPLWFKNVDLVMEVHDLSANVSYLLTSFAIDTGEIADLVARSHPHGKRIDLTWTMPEEVAEIRIYRSTSGFARQFSVAGTLLEPATLLYQGPPITSFCDGDSDDLVPNPNTSGEDLEENRFYYYSISVTWNVIPVYVTDSACVIGLSIKDYNTAFGDYVYELLPKTYRDRDAETSRGTDQYKLRDYCRMLQGTVNLYRGWMEALLHMRDPDLMPSGRHGEAKNQTGIMQAALSDFGMPSDRSLDVYTLRRLVAGLMPVLKIKGTCPGLVGITKLFTEWDATCDEASEPNCGVNQTVVTCDNESYIIQMKSLANMAYRSLGTAGTSGIGLDASVPGKIRVYWSQTTRRNALDTADKWFSPSVEVPPAFIIDAFGTFVCVASAKNIGSSTEILFSDETAQLRAELLVDAQMMGGADSIRVKLNTDDSAPWQFPNLLTDGHPTYGRDAFKGLKLITNTGAVYAITASVQDTAEHTTLTVPGLAYDGGAVHAMAIAYDWDPSGATFATRKPVMYAKLYFGEFSLNYDPLWDRRLIDSNRDGPWSLYSSLGSPLGLFYAPAPTDVTLWIDDHTSTIVEYSARKGIYTPYDNVMLDENASWTDNQWVGYYLLPNWNIPRLYRIVHNDTTNIQVDLGGSPPLSQIRKSEEGTYLILSEQNALKYARLAKLLPSFLPSDNRPIIKFTNTAGAP